MGLIELFTDHVTNRKSLKDYVELRKTINERGEFNDTSLIRAEENLQRLKREEPELYEKMYEVLAEVFRRDAGHRVEYPIDFVRQVLKLYKNRLTPRRIYEEYLQVLDHRYQTLN
jgi:hypothetical protein